MLVEWRLIKHLPADVLLAFGTGLVETVRNAYSTPGRHYHTWAHIEACLQEAAPFTFDDALTVYAALLFHDAIYVAGLKDNEARSAQLAIEALRRHTPLSAARIIQVEHLILLTASHGDLPASAGRDDQLMIDIDLSILATPANVYDRYAANVRLEWVPQVVSEEQYARGRAEFLRRMLAAPRIFHSMEFVDREAAARANIARELASL